MWKIIKTDTFGDWFTRQDNDAQSSVVEIITVLASYGPQLGRPYVDTIKDSRHPNMKELRIQSKGRPLRVLFAFDPKRNAVLLIGGDKTGDKRFYKKLIPIADDVFDKYLEENNG